MKKLLFLFLTVSLLSCSGDDSSDSVNSNHLNPPAWIQGTWGLDYGNGNTLASFRFTNNDVYTIIGSSEMSVNPNSLLNVSEEITDTKYNITLSGGGTNIYLKFEKLSDTEIRSYNQQSSTLDITLTKLD